MLSSPRCRCLWIALGALFLLCPRPGLALTATGGWTRSDVGLHNKGDGVFLGVSNAIAWDNPIFDASYGLEYVQKKGSQPTVFTGPTIGDVVGEAEVTLHVLEPSLFLGARVPGLGIVPRLYVGGSMGLKIVESWSDFPGTPIEEYGYKESDAILHVGVSLGMGPVAVDLRWSRSMVGQLLRDTSGQPLVPTAKGAELQPGVSEPEIGHKTEVVRVGLAVSF